MRLLVDGVGTLANLVLSIQRNPGTRSTEFASPARTAEFSRIVSTRLLAYVGRARCGPSATRIVPRVRRGRDPKPSHRVRGCGVARNRPNPAPSAWRVRAPP